MSVLLKFKQLSKSFLTDEIETRALSEIDLLINKGEYVSLSGQSGCGKSTLLSILGLLDVPTEGKYWLNGTDVSSLSGNERAVIRNKEIGFIFQSFNLISNLSVCENVMLPLTYRSGIDKKTIIEKVNWVLDRVDMSHRKHHFPSQLSGGQQQRVAVARALINDPSIILADEPTGNLDSKNAQAVMNLLSELHNDGSTICMVTHDQRSAEQAQRQIRLFDGKIIQDQMTDKQSKKRSVTASAIAV